MLIENMSKKKHGCTHGITQVCHFVGHVLWINPTSILQLSNDETTRLVGGAAGIALSVFIIAKKKKWF